MTGYTLYAMIAQRHMHLYGTTSEQLAEIAVAIRHHASMNPEALFRNPITMEEVVNSRMISSPLHLPDCCIITDGGGAVVVASAEVARNCRHSPVWVLGTGEAVAHQGAGKRDLMYIAAYQSQGPAFAMAGVTHEDIDMAMIYDSFTITVLETLEDLGFCQKCDRCGEYQFYPRGICANCWSEDVEWVTASGKGSVWTFTVTYQNRTPGFAQDVPYVLALVELEEGVRMFTNIVECESRDVTIGMPVEVTFVQATGDVSIPYFKPVG